jgi:hypothetical protein
MLYLPRDYTYNTSYNTFIVVYSSYCCIWYIPHLLRLNYLNKPNCLVFFVELTIINLSRNFVVIFLGWLFDTRIQTEVLGQTTITNYLHVFIQESCWSVQDRNISYGLFNNMYYICYILWINT